MKAFSYICSVGIGLVAVPSFATAAGVTYDCDTAANHFSELSLPAPANSFKVSGFVQLNSIAESTTYVPIARIHLASSAAPGKSPDAFAGFSISALPVDARKMPSGASSIQMLSYNLKGSEDQILPLSMITKPGTIQAFSLTYDGTNVLVDLGADKKKFATKIVEPVVRLICSTGEFLFTNVTIAPL